MKTSYYNDEHRPNYTRSVDTSGYECPTPIQEDWGSEEPKKTPYFRPNLRNGVPTRRRHLGK